jgi:hypothetical protein
MSGGDNDTQEETYSNIRTLFGSTHRTARWHLADEVDVLTACGRSRFDLRLVETTGRPIVEMSVTCILGSVSFVVPPGTLVVLDGTSFFARAVSEVEPGPVSDLPRIEITATTILGRVKIVSQEGDPVPEAPADDTEPQAADHAPPIVEDEATPEPEDEPADEDAAPLAS